MGFDLGTYLIFIILCIFIIINVISLIILKIQLYFIDFNIINHPFIENIIKTNLDNIAQSEDINVFHLPDNVLNQDRKNKVAGRYVYLRVNNKNDEELISEHKHIYKKILEMEKNSNKTFEELYYDVHGKKPNKLKYEYCYPRIEIGVNNEITAIDSLYNYKTFAHELGHHFAIKNEKDYSEERADEIGSELLNNIQPNYLELILGDHIRIKNSKRPKGMKFLKLLWSFYWEYYRKRKKLNKQFK